MALRARQAEYLAPFGFEPLERIFAGMGAREPRPSAAFRMPALRTAEQVEGIRRHGGGACPTADHRIQSGATRTPLTNMYCPITYGFRRSSRIHSPAPIAAIAHASSTATGPRPYDRGRPFAMTSVSSSVAADPISRILPATMAGG